MDFKFTKSELETISHIDDSPTMSELAIRMGVTKGAARISICNSVV